MEICFDRFETINKMNELDKDLLDLANKIKEVHDRKEEKHKIIMERGKKWDNLQQQSDEVAGKFDTIRKHDEPLYAELVETKKRKKANIASLKTEKSKLEELSHVPEKKHEKYSRM